MQKEKVKSSSTGFGAEEASLYLQF